MQYSKYLIALRRPSQWSFFLFCFCGMFLTACDTPRSYALEELEDNTYNSLALPSEKTYTHEELQALLDELKNKDIASIKKDLSAKGVDLLRVCYGMYYLGNNYAQEGDFEEALKYHKIAAEQYLNPLSMLKMAQLYFKGSAVLPNANISFEPDLAKAYEHLHHAMECVTEITLNNRSHLLAKITKDNGRYLLDELNKEAESGAFDKEAVRQKLKEELPDILSHLKEMYNLVRHKE